MGLPAGFFRFKAVGALVICAGALVYLGAMLLRPEISADDGLALARLLAAAVLIGALGNWAAARVAVRMHPRVPAKPLYLAATFGLLAATVLLLRSDAVGGPISGLEPPVAAQLGGALSTYTVAGFLIGCMLIEARRSFRQAALRASA